MKRKCDHVFELKHARGNRYPVCVYCSFLPSDDALLDAYIKVNGGRRWP